MNRLAHMDLTVTRSPRSRRDEVIRICLRASAVAMLVISLATSWYVGSRAYAAISLSESAQFIRYCGGKLAYLDEGRQRSVEKRKLIFDDPGGAPPRSVDARWQRLFRLGRGPTDVCGVEFHKPPDSHIRAHDLRQAISDSTSFPNLEWLIIPDAVIDNGDSSSMIGFRRLKLLIIHNQSDQETARIVRQVSPECEIFLSNPDTGDLAPLP